MGRPLTKMNKEKLLFLIENAGKISNVEIAKSIGVDTTIVIYYRKKLAKHGLVLPKFERTAASAADDLIKEVLNELRK